MRALVIYAHPEPRSFNAALLEAGAAALTEQGYSVEVSDLYAARFKAVLDRDDFLTTRDPERLNLTLEQRHASAHGGLAPDIRAELDRVKAADLLVFQFPLWWFSMPAVLKGWFDRVFVSGEVYGRAHVYERGKLAGRRALLAVTTGAPAESYGPHALNGDMLDILMPIHRGILGFVGMTVLPPFVAYHVPYAEPHQRAEQLEAYRQHLRSLDALPPLPMPRLADHAAALGPLLHARATLAPRGASHESPGCPPGHRGGRARVG